MSERPVEVNRYSSRITQPPNQGASQAMPYATGLTPADLQKAQVGIASCWYEGNPCNMHLGDLANHVKRGVVESDLVGLRFGTIGVSDGISMGTDGMSYSLQSRDLIADSIETVMAAHWYDALVTLPGCDKNMPGCVMAMGRLDRPAIMVYGGTIEPGWAPIDGVEEKLDVSFVLGNGAHVPTLETAHVKGCELFVATSSSDEANLAASSLARDITEAERQRSVAHACPGPGACGGMYTANTMASAIEALGLTLPYSSSTPAIDPAKIDECVRAGRAVRTLLEADLRPRQIVTRASLENAMVVTMALGGSTNAVLHLIAIARAFDLE